MPSSSRISTLSLHDALPIYGHPNLVSRISVQSEFPVPWQSRGLLFHSRIWDDTLGSVDHDIAKPEANQRVYHPRHTDLEQRHFRSEEHTSELQSLRHLVCRLPPGSLLFPYTTLFRSMDTLISYHGFQSSLNFLFRGNLEVFYFTREYGMTRWEVWTTISQNPKPTSECTTPATQTLNNVTLDRKSTRLNSSHLGISYAVFLPDLYSFPTRRSSDLWTP